jgi:hypothetical protein
MTSPSRLREHAIHATIASPTTGEASPHFTFFGIIDSYRDGVLEDYKTTQDPREYAQEQALSPQLGLYAAALEENGFPVLSIRYRLLQRPLLRLKKNQTPREYIDEIRDRCLEPGNSLDQEQPITTQIVETAREIASEVATRILDLRARGTWLPNRSACHKFGRPCEFLPLCLAAQNGGDIDALISEAYRIRDEGRADRRARREPDQLSFSGIDTFTTCERLFYWRYDRNLKATREEDSEPMEVGKSFHFFLEAGECEPDEWIYSQALPAEGQEPDPRTLKAAGMALAARKLWFGGQPDAQAP